MGIENLEKVGSDIPDRKSPPPDELAKQELQKQFCGDDRRNEEAKQAFHGAFIWFVRVSAFIVIIIFAVRMACFVLPTKWQWVSEDQIKGIDAFLFHGTVGGIIVAYLRRSIPGSKPDPE